MVLFFLIAALFLGARLLVARALKLRPWLLPREGSLRERALVALAGPLACVLALVLVAFTVALVDGVRRPAPPAVTSVSPGSAAERAGLVPGDRIVAVEGRGVQTVADVQGQVQVTAGRPFALEIERADLPNLKAYYDRLTERPAYSRHVMISYDYMRAK